MAEGNDGIWSALTGLFDKAENALVMGLTSVFGLGFYGVLNLFKRVNALETKDRERAEALRRLEAGHAELTRKLGEVPTRNEMFARLDRQDQRTSEILGILTGQDRREEKRERT